jgi:hypothetical protein
MEQMSTRLDEAAGRQKLVLHLLTSMLEFRFLYKRLLPHLFCTCSIQGGYDEGTTLP